MTKAAKGAAFAAGCLMAMIAIGGCNQAPGKPTEASVPIPPSEVTDFVTLYGENCAGCHGTNANADARKSLAISLMDPAYQALVDDATLRKIVANGVPGSLMPGFGSSGGGLLTDKQIDALVKGMRGMWANPAVTANLGLPPYRSTGAGDAQRGADAYARYCASCHGEAHGKPGKAGSVTDPSYLSLISDQGLRTTVILGRPEYGAPDWRNNVPGHPMANQEIDDVVAWLSSQRPATSPLSGSNRVMQAAAPAATPGGGK